MDFYIEYQIVDPIKAYINSQYAISILKNLAQSYIRDTVGLTVDEVITTGKSEIQAKRFKSLLSERLEQEDIGIGIVNVTIQDAEPPTEAVNNAFKAVEDAKQGMDTKINEAKKYQSEQLPAANAKADKAARDAEAYRQQRISEAEGQVVPFNDMYEEYAKYPLITKKRMFYETMEELLPNPEGHCQWFRRNPRPCCPWIHLSVKIRTEVPGNENPRKIYEKYWDRGGDPACGHHI